MPLYEYQCSDCGERFEVLQSLGSDSRDLSCPQCRGSEVEKVFSTFAAGAQGRAAATAAAGCGSGFT